MRQLFKGDNYSREETIRGNTAHNFLIEPAAGASDDWYKGVLDARFVYTVELRDTGYHGFVLPPDQIKPRLLESGLT